MELFRCAREYRTNPELVFKWSEDFFVRAYAALAIIGEEMEEHRKKLEAEREQQMRGPGWSPGW